MRRRICLAAVALTAVAAAASAQNTGSRTASPGTPAAAPGRVATPGRVVTPAQPGANFRFFPGIGAVPQGRFETGSSFVFRPGVGFAPAGDARTRTFQFVPNVGFVPRASTFDNQGDFVFVPGVGFVPSDQRNAAFERRFNRFRFQQDVGFVPTGNTVNVSGQPFIEGEVIRVSPASIVVRLTANGGTRTATFPTSQVFVLQNGALVAASSIPGGPRVGLRVLVPGAAVTAPTGRRTGRVNRR